MKRARVPVLLSAAVFALVSGPDQALAQGGPPVPSILYTNPYKVVAGGPQFSLSVYGYNFTDANQNPAGTVLWNGTPLPTQASMDPSGYYYQLLATVPASLIATPGTANITVAALGGTSAPLPLEVFGITSLNPNQAAPGSSDLTIVITGVGFLLSEGPSSASIAQWTSGGVTTDLDTTYDSDTQLTAVVPAALLTSPGTAEIRVLNIYDELISAPVTFTIAYPGPVIESITPQAGVAACAGFQITVDGSNFDRGATVRWQAIDPSPSQPVTLATTYVGPTRLTAVVPASLALFPGAAEIVVINSAGAISEPYPYELTPERLALTSVQPNAATPGGPSVGLVLTGTGFLPLTEFTESTVQWQGADGATTPLSTTVTSSCTLSATVPASLLAVPGVAQVSVVNQPIEARPQTSNALPFTIAFAGLSVQSVSPSPGIASCTGFRITVNGAGFAAGATVRWLGAGQPQATVLPTTFVNANQLRADVPANLVLEATTASISVVNPGGAVSGVLVYTVSPAPLTLTSVQPNAVTAGGSSIGLALSGTGFLPAIVAGGSVVQWRGADGTVTPLQTTVLSRCSLSAAVPANLVQTPGGALVSVLNPQTATTGQAVSNGLPFTITIPPLTVTPNPLASGAVGQRYSGLLGAQGGQPPYRWSVSAGSLPPGLGLAADGAITGTPTAPGTYGFTARVTDSNQGFATGGFSIVIKPAPLSISPPSLPDGRVDSAYSQSLTGSGGVPPYRWSISSGALPPGLSLSGSGLISGTPTQRGPFQFTVQLTDNEKSAVTRGYLVTIAPAPLTIATLDSLSKGVVGTAYSQTFAAAGGVPPYTWSVTTGALPDGLSLTAATGVLGGKPALSGTFTFTIQVTDESKDTSRKVFTVTVDPPRLAITTSTLGNGTAGSVYSAQLAAEGGTPPYTWSLPGGVPGISVDRNTGALSGTPSEAGTFQVVARVTDKAGASATRGYNITIAPVVPAVTLDVGGTVDPSGNASPAEQPSLTIKLGSAYPFDITGQLTLVFTPNAAVPVDDPSIVFPNNTRTMTFTIPRGTTTASFDEAPNVPFGTGTVAGEIKLTVRLQQDGADATPAPQPTRTIIIEQTAPVLLQQDISVVRTAGGLEVRIIGYSTPREITKARFRFGSTGTATLQTSDFTLDVSSAFLTWYQDPASAAFGSAFRYVQPFTVQGDTTAINSVTVTLSNSKGDSQPMTVTF